MLSFGFHCKTPNCGIYLKVGDVPEDAARVAFVPVNLSRDPRSLTCPECGKTHEYFFSDKTIAKVAP